MLNPMPSSSVSSGKPVERKISAESRNVDSVPVSLSNDSNYNGVDSSVRSCVYGTLDSSSCDTDTINDIVDNLQSRLRGDDLYRRINFDQVALSLDTFCSDSSPINWEDTQTFADSSIVERDDTQLNLNKFIDQLVRTIVNNSSNIPGMTEEMSSNLRKVLTQNDPSLTNITNLVSVIASNEGGSLVLEKSILELEKIIKKNSLSEVPAMIIGQTYTDRRLFVLAYLILTGLVNSSRSTYNTQEAETLTFDTKFLYPGNGHLKYNDAIQTPSYMPFHKATEQAFGSFVYKLFDVPMLVQNKSLVSGKDHVNFIFLGPGKDEMQMVLRYLEIVKTQTYNFSPIVSIDAVSNSIRQIDEVFSEDFLDQMSGSYSVCHADMMQFELPSVLDSTVRFLIMKGGTSCNKSDEQFLAFVKKNVLPGTYLYIDFQPTLDYTDADLKKMYSTHAALDFVTHNPLHLLSVLGANEMELRSFRNYVDVDVMSHRAPFTYAKTVRHSVDMSSISSDLIMRIKEKSGLDFSTRSRWVLSESTRRDPEGFVNFLNNQGFEVMQFHSSVGHIPQVVGMLISSAV